MKTAFHPADLAGIQVRPSRLWTQSLSWILFAVGIALYAQFSIARHKENPEDRVGPSAQQLIQGIKSAALEAPEEDDSVDANAPLIERFSHSMLWKDTLSSGKRFLIALALLIPAILLGLHMAVFPYFGSLCLRFVTFFDKIVALSLLPILFIVFGIEEWSKIALMVIGVAPTPGWIWIGGYWNWVGGRHEWVPGRWQAGRPGRAACTASRSAPDRAAIRAAHRVTARTDSSGRYRP